MNKTAIKSFAVWARNKLRSEIIYKAGLLGINEKGIAEPLPQSTESLQIFDIGTNQPVRLENKTVIEQRRSLAAAITAKQLPYSESFDAVVEQVAYTWFNRLIAIRFMEVNDYLPGRIRILSSENPDKAEPDIVTHPFESDFEFTLEESEMIDRLKDTNKLDELFQFLFIRQCNKLSEILPELFEQTDDYTELLMNVSFTDSDGIVRHLINDIPEDDFNIKKEGQVEIIGWLYQYYNTEQKEKVFSRSVGTKINKEDIPAATQLFTPDWIVRYMVENSLGRIFSSKLKAQSSKSEKEIAEKMGWKYFLPEAEQAPEVYERLKNLTTDHSPLNTTFLDPCMGSGHILVYAFDVFMSIYKSQGYTERDAARIIVENNLYGLDIDDRAAQLAYFAVMMKARSYDRRFLTRHIRPNICSIQESNSINTDYSELFGELKDTAEKLYNEFIDAKEYGSILRLKITADEIDQLESKYNEIINTDYDNVFDIARKKDIIKHFPALLAQAKIMVRRYDAVCTNPPYMGGNFSPKLDAFIKKNYADYKSDLFSVFMIRCSQMTKPDGYSGFLTPYVWMFIHSYVKLRKHLYTNQTIETLIQFEYSAFKEATVPICTFTLKNRHIRKKGCYLRLTDFRGGMEVQREKVLEALSDHDCGYYFESYADNFSKIPGSPAAYWMSENFIRAFENGTLLGKTAEPKQGLATADNNRFLREWYEVCNNKINFHADSLNNAKNSKCKWFPYNKGGEFRKWYGNNDYIVNWENDGFEIKNFYDNKGKLRSRPQNTAYYFRECFSWSLVSSGTAAFRYKPSGHIFDVAGMSCFCSDKRRGYYLLALCNSCCVREILKVIAPTINYQCGDIANIPVISPSDTSVLNRINDIVNENIQLCKTDWDSFETSWDFEKHPLI